MNINDLFQSHNNLIALNFSEYRIVCRFTHPSVILTSLRVTHTVGLLKGCTGHTQEHKQDMLPLDTGCELEGKRGSRAMISKRCLLCFSIANIAKCIKLFD